MKIGSWVCSRSSLWRRTASWLRLSAVDVDEHQHRAVDPVLERPVGPEAQRVPVPVAVLHLELLARATVSMTSASSCSRSGTSMLSLMSLIGRPTSAGIRLSSFSATGVKRRMRRSAPSITIAICDAGEQVHEVVVAAAQLEVAVLELLVDGGQLLVARLDLLLRGLELLVDALQLLVGRLHLLVGGLELLVGGLLLLDDRLQVLARGRQLLLQRGRALARPSPAAVGARPGRRAWPRLRARGRRRRIVRFALGPVVLEEHEKRRVAVAGGPAPGRPRTFTVAIAAVRSARAGRPRATGDLLALGPVHGAAHRDQQALAQHLEQVEAGLARRGREIEAGVAAELEDLDVAVDEHARRRVLRQEQPVGFLLDRRRAAALPSRRPGVRARRPARVRTAETGTRGAAMRAPGLLRVDLVLASSTSNSRGRSRWSRSCRATGSRPGAARSAGSG